MTKRERLVASIFTPLLIGCIGLFNFMSEPRFASIRTVDVVRLIAFGMCFGVALVSFLILLRGKGDA